jgi:transcriptional regulator with XRE-family HTH domain
MNSFGDAVRHLMEAKKVSGLKLAESIGITPTSVSRILTGQSRPRQVTLTRIMRQLCQTQDEEQLLIRAYSGLESLPQEAVSDDKRNAEEEEARVKRFLEVKTQSILFKRSVAKELDKAGIDYTIDFCQGAISTDFLIERDGKRIALECRFNVQRDLERAVLTANFLKKELGCESVITVVPYDISEASPQLDDFVTATPNEVIDKILTIAN